MDDNKEVDVQTSAEKELWDFNLYIIGRITEEMSLNFIADLFNLSESILSMYPDPNDRPYITVSLNTYGGDLFEMFAMYDAMKRVQRQGIQIETLGLGKVMSSGLLLLAAGTKGLRTLGKYTRLMFHEANGDLSGTHNELNEQKKELDFAQEQYLNALCEETKKSRKFFDSFIKKHVDIYISAEEAIKWKLADCIDGQ